MTLGEAAIPRRRIEPALEGATAADIVRWTYANHPRVAIVASFQAESTVLIHLASQIVERPEVITLDTGRLPQETHQMIDMIRDRYPIDLQVRRPDDGEVSSMVEADGEDLFYTSLELRQRCCEIRKSRPLARALEGYDAWLTGVRRSQGPSRAATPVAATDRDHGGILKVAPLAGWSKAEVLSFIESHQIPTHPLYARGYASIGCDPCTRAIKPDEDELAGRWFWETGGVKECGIHPNAG